MKFDRTIVSGFVVSSLLVLAGCASGGANSAGASDKKPMEENAVVHQATDAEKAATHSRTPVAEGKTALYVNGLGCPQCASNVDVQLMRLPGVDKADVDLSTGIVTINVKGNRRPSPHQISESVLDAGFTLVKLEKR